jgi:hypothetical protein
MRKTGIFVQSFTMNIRPAPLLLVLLAFFSLHVAAQELSPSVSPDQAAAKRTAYGLNAGTLFSTSSGYGSGISTYFSPHLSYSLSSRFCIDAGITLITTSFVNQRPYYPGTSEASYTGNLTSAFLYLHGRYRLSDKLLLSGTVYKEFGISGYSKGDYPFSKEHAQGLFMNADYKVTEHFHIQAGFGYSKGQNPFYTDPFGHQGMGGIPYFHY